LTYSVKMLRYWLDRLEDPFETFPMQSVARSLAQSAEEQEEHRFERSSRWGVSSAYYSGEDEHDIEVVEILAGTACVLGQAYITQAVSLVKKMHEDAGKPDWIPSAKDKIMELAAPIHTDTGLSQIAIINALANYYKHHYEWWDDWSGPQSAESTISIAVKLGLSPKAYHNIENALKELKIYLPNISALTELVVTWRGSLALYIKGKARDNGIDASTFWDDPEPNASQY
jgi:hypothetical protein